MPVASGNHTSVQQRELAVLGRIGEERRIGGGHGGAVAGRHVHVRQIVYGIREQQVVRCDRQVILPRLDSFTSSRALGRTSSRSRLCPSGGRYLVQGLHADIGV